MASEFIQFMVVLTTSDDYFRACEVVQPWTSWSKNAPVHVDFEVSDYPRLVAILSVSDERAARYMDETNVLLGLEVRV